MNAANLDPSDIQLSGQFLSSSFVPTSASYDASGTVLTLTFSGLPDDAYTLVLISGDGAFEDVVGFDLDGEPLAWPIPPNVSGDGVEGGISSSISPPTPRTEQARPRRWWPSSRWAA